MLVILCHKFLSKLKKIYQNYLSNLHHSGFLASKPYMFQTHCKSQKALIITGKETPPGQCSKHDGGQGPEEHLRPGGARGDRPSGPPLHPIQPEPSAEDVRGCPNARRRRPCGEMGSLAEARNAKVSIRRAASAEISGLHRRLLAHRSDRAVGPQVMLMHWHIELPIVQFI